MSRKLWSSTPAELDVWCALHSNSRDINLLLHYIIPLFFPIVAGAYNNPEGSRDSWIRGFVSGAIAGPGVGSVER